MRAVVQCVKKAGVTVDNELIGSIEEGVLLFLGIEEGDTEEDLRYICDKTINLRVFEDDEGKLNRSVADINGGILLVSQFTLCGDARKGRRPSYIKAARPETALPLYEKAIALLGGRVRVATGKFQAKMEVTLINDGPVTILLDSKRLF
ncbi:MAG: D-tyrosyl-tRNA(Tyr) deacylase [Clostridiales bacterium]|jgi:D-tyrosyl-tRNA(Tyr) deacylase|nr:D-tyrosyl-tRNA(Tyr) deacylase [Clostridiales bacterium]